MTKITSAIAAAVLASVSFATAALADEGDYYQGANRPVAGQQASTWHNERGAVSYGYTGSIANAQNGRDADGTVILNRGDYYEGANRPN